MPAWSYDDQAGILLILTQIQSESTYVAPSWPFQDVMKATSNHTGKNSASLSKVEAKKILIHYSEYVEPKLYDRNIACHPYIDAMNGSVIYRLLENLGFVGPIKTVLDAGTGTGQVCRLLNGIPSIVVEACDVDPMAKEFFMEHPETRHLPYHTWDIVNHRLPKRFDAIILRGVFHHIPKDDRSRLLSNVIRSTETIIISDEGILEYSNEVERRLHCDTWYGFVIKEARRRGLRDLATIETSYWKHERLNTADDGGDFKESPSDLMNDAMTAGLRIASLDRIGDWQNLKGGMYTAVLKSA